MANLIASFLLISIIQVSSVSTQDIEKAFLQNDAKTLYQLIPENYFINISLPEPISFSDQVSNQQAYFLFKKIFSSYLTFEFYSMDRFSVFSEKKSFIFKGRWSFQDRKNNNKYVFHIFFYMKSFERKNENKEDYLKIVEIKAERI